jgi:PAS domain S-box-containing protein
VDDEEPNRDLLHALLESFGYESETAVNGTDAIAKLDSEIDLVLLDVLMPEMDGFAVVRQIRASPDWSDLPVIMVTVLDGKSDRIRAVEAGANDFVSKPIDMLELKVRIASLLQMKEALDAIKRHRAELEETVERRTAELCETEERFRTVFQAAHDLIFLKDINLRYTHVNPAMLRLADRAQSDLIGNTDEMLYDYEYARQIQNLEDRVLKGQTIESEHIISYKGLPRTFNLVRFPLRGPTGEIIGICGIGRDNTQRAQIDARPKAEAGHYPSSAMRETLRRVRLVAESDSLVLFLGESGSGKDYLARYLHEKSKRAGGPFLSINCAALAAELVESELFGHEAGAFTGAHGRKRGLVELAEGGTLLLNEIGDLPLRLQSKLLAFLDTAQFIRVGGERSVSVNARIVAATNRDLKREVENGNFREDLFHRLNVFTIEVPPLRERRADLPLLVQEILESLAQRIGLSHVPIVELEAIEPLADREWPGNVRELRNFLERGLILSNKNRITAQDLQLPKNHPGQTDGNDISVLIRLSEAGSFHEAIDETKRRLLEESLRQSGGSIKQAAEHLKVSRDSFVHHMRALGVRK